MTDNIYNVLFLCTGNSARSILAESIINKWGKGQFRGFSAGSHHNLKVNPLALNLLKDLDFPREGLHSKNRNEFAGPSGIHFDFVITVCDNAAGNGRTRAPPIGGCTVDGCSVDRRDLLVHGLNLMRQPGDHYSQVVDEHILGYSAHRCARFILAKFSGALVALGMAHLLFPTPKLNTSVTAVTDS